MVVWRAVSETRTSDEKSSHPAGVRRVLVLFGVLVASAAMPYFVPGLERLRAFVPGDAVPFTRFFDFRPPTRVAIGGATERSERERSDEELLAAAPLPTAPSPRVRGARAGALGDLRIPADELAGLRRPIEDPSGAMEHFYESLRAAARRERGALTRILLYSDSVNGSDLVTSALRSSLQQRFGDGGKGFVPIAPGWQYQRHQDVVWNQANGWRVRVVNRGRDPIGRYGLGGVLAINGSQHSTAAFATTDEGPGQSVATVRLLYQAWPGGGVVRLRVDDRAPVLVPTDAAVVEDMDHDLRVPDGAHSLEVGVESGELRLYGVVMEREGPGVVVDGLMLVGAFTRVLGNFDGAHWRAQMAMREPDLVVFWVGENDVISRTTGFDPEAYTEGYAQSLARWRPPGSPASCLVMSVLDSGESVDGAVQSVRRVPRVVAAQRAAARRAGCAFLDAYEAMGGRESVRRWLDARPRLVSGDYRHLTPEGARIVSMLLRSALLAGYDDFLAAEAGVDIR